MGGVYFAAGGRQTEIQHQPINDHSHTQTPRPTWLKFTFLRQLSSQGTSVTFRRCDPLGQESGMDSASLVL